MMELLHNEVINIVVTLLGAGMAYLTKVAISYLKKKGLITQMQNNKVLVGVVVNAIEQTYQHLHGEEKFNLAKVELLKMMQRKNIRITEKELDFLIEAMVKEMNETAKIELK